MITALLMAASAVAVPAPDGVWINPAQSVRVRIEACGGALCGTVIAATLQAQADARSNGGSSLIGMALLRDYRRTGPNSWQGRVFVPDWKREFFSRIVATRPGEMRVSGCVLGGWLCKSQVWTRL